MTVTNRSSRSYTNDGTKNRWFSRINQIHSCDIWHDRWWSDNPIWLSVNICSRWPKIFKQNESKICFGQTREVYFVVKYYIRLKHDHAAYPQFSTAELDFTQIVLLLVISNMPDDLGHGLYLTLDGGWVSGPGILGAGVGDANKGRGQGKGLRDEIPTPDYHNRENANVH